MDDLRDLLEQAVGSYRPRGGLEAVQARVRRRRTVRRITAAAVALSTLLVPGWLAWSAWRGTQRPASEEPTRYVDPLGWAVEVPPGWHVLTFGGFNGRQRIVGAAISSVPLRPSEDGTSVRLEDVEPGGAAVLVLHAEGGPAPDPLRDDSTLPLRWEDLTASRIYGAMLPFRARGLDFILGVALGPEAPPELEETARAVVGSIEPLPLREGEILPSGFVVVPADPVETVGSGAVVETGRGAFLVIHAPGGTYALGLPEDGDGGFAWDEDAREVAWTRDGEVWARYDREGRVVLAPEDARLTPLEIHPVVRAFDGEHLLLHPDVTYGPLPARMWS